MNNPNIFGLKELERDSRDFKLGSIFSLPSDLPEEFVLENPFTPDVQEDDFCTGYARAGMVSLREGKKMSGKVAFGFSKYITKDPDTWGQDLRSALKTSVELGDLPIEYEPTLDIKETRRIYERADFNTLKEKAHPYGSQSYFFIETFDELKGYIWKFRDKKQAVLIGVRFGWGLEEERMTTVPEGGFGHAMYAYGWKGDYAVVRNSYGERAGNKGDHLIHKSVINYFLPKFGGGMLVDISPEEAKRRIISGIKDTDNAIIDILKSLLSAIKQILGLQQQIIEIKKEEIKEVQKPDLIQLWAEAIRDFEGYEEHNISFRNKNPGNIKDRKGDFLKFKTHEAGFEYLKNYLRRACTGEHRAYKPTMTLRQAMAVYAPDGDVVITNYTNHCAKRMKIAPSTKLKEIYSV